MRGARFTVPTSALLQKAVDGRAAANVAFAEFLDDKRYSRNQIQFVTLIIDELTARGAVEPARIYESPYDGLAPEGPEAIFVERDVDKIFSTISTLTASRSPRSRRAGALITARACWRTPRAACT